MEKLNVHEKQDDYSSEYMKDLLNIWKYEEKKEIGIVILSNDTIAEL
jgi:hypothetical protein